MSVSDTPKTERFAVIDHRGKKGVMRVVYQCPDCFRVYTEGNFTIESGTAGHRKDRTRGLLREGTTDTARVRIGSGHTRSSRYSPCKFRHRQELPHNADREVRA